MTLQQVPLELIDDNPFQTRTSYPRNTIDELAASIREHGLRQPPEARPKDGRFELAYGHLRKRAYQKLAKEDPQIWGAMPLHVHEMSDDQMFYLGIEENLRRADVRPIELARIVDAFLVHFPDKTEEEVAGKLNMSRPNVSNMRRVLRLPDQVLEKIDEGRITFTQGRELLVFEGITAPGLTAPREPCDLMTEAIRGLKTGNMTYGEPNTVDGLQRSIHLVAKRYLRALEKEHASWRGEPLFDTREAGCLKCEQTMRTHPTKSTAAHWCTDQDCWTRHQEAHKNAAAEAAMAKMREDVLSKVAAEVQQEKAQNVSQETSPVAVTPELLAEIKASYSAHRISAGLSVRKPVEVNGKLYISTGDAIQGPGQQCYQVVPREEFQGEVRTYNVPPDREYDEYYESLRNDPMGFYHGMSVKRGESECVLVGPEITFAARDLEEKREEPPADRRDREVDQEAERAPAEREYGVLPCETCARAEDCDRTYFYRTPVDGYACDEKIPGPDAVTLVEDIPPELRTLAEEKAGTRAEVLDLNGLWADTYRDELGKGYARLDPELQRIDDPEECLLRCTRGFHYAFDSSGREGEVYQVCGDPKCLARKKAAFTRAKNAQGMAKKRVEASAIKQAVQNTTCLDRPRMKLIVMAQLEGTHVKGHFLDAADPKKWWMDRLQVNDASAYSFTPSQICSTIDERLDDEALAKAIVEFMLEVLRYRGEPEGYRVSTTESLNWMGVAVQVQQENAGEHEPADSQVPAAEDSQPRRRKWPWKK